jgi:MEKHLA domain
MPEAPNAAPRLATDAAFYELLTGSFARLLGRPLVPAEANAAWLYRVAPFAVVAHNTDADPRFVYANIAAQTCFEYSWAEFTALPSRLSAEPMERAERQRLLDAVTRDGFIADYRGVRIAKSGRRFWIEDAIVWQLIDRDGNLRGQAATFSSCRDV